MYTFANGSIIYYKLERKLSIRMYSLTSLKIYMYVCQGERGINLSVYERFKVCVYVHTYYTITSKKRLQKCTTNLQTLDLSREWDLGRNLAYLSFYILQILFKLAPQILCFPFPTQIFVKQTSQMVSFSQLSSLVYSILPIADKENGTRGVLEISYKGKHLLNLLIGFHRYR